MAEEAKPRIGAGDVEIRLRTSDGEDELLMLRPTYNAARVLSAQAGGLVAVAERVGRLDLEAITEVIALGLGYGTQTKRTPQDLGERVWRTGLSDDTGGLAERCVLFVRVLMSGGRMPPKEARDDSENPRQP